jgi:hypothetical protein
MLQTAIHFAMDLFLNDNVHINKREFPCNVNIYSSLYCCTLINVMTWQKIVYFVVKLQNKMFLTKSVILITDMIVINFNFFFRYPVFVILCKIYERTCRFLRNLK